jgi:hypothetical protein
MFKEKLFNSFPYRIDKCLVTYFNLTLYSCLLSLCFPVDGVWVPVGDWLPCNATCQSQLNVDAQGNRFYLGHAHRSQRCQDRTGGHVRIDLGGIPCNGDAVEVRNCSILAKPCDGKGYMIRHLTVNGHRYLDASSQ